MILPNSKKGRLWIIGGLIVVALVAFYFIKGTTAKVILGAVIAILALAFGMEASNTDYDIGKAIETGSLAEAKIERNPSTGDITNVDAFCSAAKSDYNCPDFKTQPEAQGVYARCKGLGKNMDVYRLDGDNDGLVCEALPKGAQ